MKTVVLRILLVAFATFAAVLALGGTLTVTSPTEGNFLGKSNQVTFNISGASVKVTVQVKVTYPDGSQTIIPSVDFNPDFNGKISGSIPLNFGASAPEGNYTLDVSATEQNNTYTDQTVHVKVDVVAPKFEEVSPTDGAYVKGVVHIRATVKETNLKAWRVLVNNQDIPNNTGTSNTIAVDWDTTNILSDGSQSITIKVDDLAGNTTTQTINLNLDRVPPIISITYPRSDTTLVPGSDITVIVDLQDGTSSSVDKTGLDVIAKKLDGTYVTRVSLTSFKSTGSTTYRWVGRIRYRRKLLPTSFKIVANAVDRAGNAANPQEVTLTLGRGKH